jgi:hypothetical protein
MAKTLTGNYVAMLTKTTTEDIDGKIQLRLQSTGELVYEFLPSAQPYGRIEFYEPDSLIAFTSNNGKIYVYKLSDENGTYGHTLVYETWAYYYDNASVTYGSGNSNLAFDGDGNLYTIALYKTDNFTIKKLSWDGSTYTHVPDTGGVTDGYMSGVCGSASHGSEVIYVPDRGEKGQIWYKYNWGQDDNAGVFAGVVISILDCDSGNIVKHINMTDDLGFGGNIDNAWHQNYVTTQNFRTRNTMVYNPHRKSVFVSLSSSINQRTLETNQLVAIDIDNYYIKTLLDVNKFLGDEGSEQTYYGVSASPVSGRVSLFSSTKMLWTSIDDTQFSFIDVATATPNTGQISVNPITEETVIGNVSGVVLMDNQGNIKWSQTDLESVHVNACFLNNSDTTTPPSGISAPRVVVSPQDDKTDLTPNYIIELANSPVGTEQYITYCEGTLAQMTEGKEYSDNDWTLKVDVSATGEYSTNYNEATGNGDWYPIGGSGLVKNEETINRVFVKWELDEQPVGQHYGRIFVH